MPLVTPIGPRILPGPRADKAMFSRQPFVVSDRTDAVFRDVRAPDNDSILPRGTRVKIHPIRHFQSGKINIEQYASFVRQNDIHI